MDDTENKKLMKSGKELYSAMRDSRDPADVDALVIQACRIKDRLDKLQYIISAEDYEWCNLRMSDTEDGVVYLYIDKAMQEVRSTEVNFYKVLGEIERRRAQYIDADEEVEEEDGLAGLV